MIDSFRSLPVGKYLEILDIAKNEALDAVEHQVQILSILTGLTPDEVLELPLATYSDYALRSQFLNREIDSVPGLAKQYKCNGYTLIPCLDPAKMIAGQYIDFQTFCQKGEDAIVEILSCFLIPAGHKYNRGYDIADVHKAIREDLSTAEAIALYGFFFVKSQESMRDILTSSRKLIQSIPRKEMRKKAMAMLDEAISKADGDGLLGLTKSAKRAASRGRR